MLQGKHVPQITYFNCASFNKQRGACILGISLAGNGEEMIFTDILSVLHCVSVCVSLLILNVYINIISNSVLRLKVNKVNDESRAFVYRIQSVCIKVVKDILLSDLNRLSCIKLKLHQPRFPLYFSFILVDYLLICQCVCVFWSSCLGIWSNHLLNVLIKTQKGLRSLIWVSGQFRPMISPSFIHALSQCQFDT